MAHPLLMPLSQVWPYSGSTRLMDACGMTLASISVWLEMGNEWKVLLQHNYITNQVSSTYVCMCSELPPNLSNVPNLETKKKLLRSKVSPPPSASHLPARLLPDMPRSSPSLDISHWHPRRPRRIARAKFEKCFPRSLRKVDPQRFRSPKSRDPHAWARRNHLTKGTVWGWIEGVSALCSLEEQSFY